MPHVAAKREHDDRHDDRGAHRRSAGGGCRSAGVDNTCGDIGPANPTNASGRSFRANGLDCAEEVAILNQVVGPEVGGTVHLAFDILSGRMTVLDSAGPDSDERVVKLVASTGRSVSLNNRFDEVLCIAE